MSNMTVRNYPQKYSVTDKKKAELDALRIQVDAAQAVVVQNQAIVNSLADKSQKFNGFLTTADARRTKTLADKNQFDQVIEVSSDLKDNSTLALVKIQGAGDNDQTSAVYLTNALGSQCKDVIDKLIYSAEMVNRLAAVVIREKALNPLISDDLVSMLAQAGSDANNAVTLALIALKSSAAACASNVEAEAALSLENMQSQNLFALMSGIGQKVQRSLLERIEAAFERELAKIDLGDLLNEHSSIISQSLGDAFNKTQNQGVIAINALSVFIDFFKADLIAASKNSKIVQDIIHDLISCLESAWKAVFHGSGNEAADNISLKALITKEYTNALHNYSTIFKANQEVTGQLNFATQQLNKSQVTLSSLQSGFAAANAAALAN